MVELSWSRPIFKATRIIAAGGFAMNLRVEHPVLAWLRAGRAVPVDF
jgi:hypothetical protein